MIKFARSLVLLAMVTPAFAQPIVESTNCPPETAQRVPAPVGPKERGLPPPRRLAVPAEPNAIPLYKGIAPGSEGATYHEIWTGIGDQSWVRNVTRPTLTPFIPQKGKANGTAVLVVPGGGFKFVSITNEGWPIAQGLLKPAM